VQKAIYSIYQLMMQQQQMMMQQQQVMQNKSNRYITSSWACFTHG
jgi:hypothetical protein